jgi:menaquinone-specific isochorismate synthase
LDLNVDLNRLKPFEFMPAVPYCSYHSPNLQSIPPVIAEGLKQVQHHRQARVISLNFDIPEVDPLLALAELSHSRERHLYLEHGATKDAVAAFGTALFFQATGTDRFNQTRQFIQQWAPKIQVYDTASGVDSTAARFFCSFSFFPQGTGSGMDFPTASAMLPQWQITRHCAECTLTANLLLTSETSLTQLLDTLEARLEALDRLHQKNWTPSNNYCPRLSLLQPSHLAGHQFKTAVAAAIKHISRRHLQKVVLAHAFDLVRQEPFQTLQSLMELRQRHPDCYVFSISNRQGKTFIGASPERLLSLYRGQLITDALAGSAPRGRNPREDRQLSLRLVNSRKEQGEHRMVVDFLASQLESLGLCPQYPKRPSLLRLSNIQHLHTPIQAVVSGTTHPLHMVEALHPTPAVAGVPTQEAFEQIHTYEQFDRGLYAAPLGWVDTQGNSEFIVGIRSALIDDNWARLYAGAGIVAGSDPEREWAEINLKFRALSEALV